jgi:hypothetical protein
MDIPYQLQQIAVAINQYGFKPASKQLTITMVCAIKTLGVDPIDVPHAS